MQDSKIFKIVIGLLVLSLIAILVKHNVTATKEIDSLNNNSQLTLEINSDTVKRVYAKITLLDGDAIKDDTYKYLYFNIEDEKKRLSNEDKLYIAFNSLYKKNVMTKTKNEDGTENLKIDLESVKNEVDTLFKDENFDPMKTNYKSSINCGIVDYLFTGAEYELKFKKCDLKNEVNKTKLISAEKTGNYIKLKVKSFYAITDHIKIDDSKDIFSIKNYYEDSTLTKTSLKRIENETDEIFENDEIDEYVFSFELIGDDYYLVEISKP